MNTATQGTPRTSNTIDEYDKAIGTVTSEEGMPSFEAVRVKLKTNCDVKPGALLRIPTLRGNIRSTLVGRVKSAYEHNPNEKASDINVRDTLKLRASYPQEDDSTTIYRVADADLIEEIIYDERNGKEATIIVAPQTLPVSGSAVYLANEREVIDVLGLTSDTECGLYIGTSVGGNSVPIKLKREVIQRHLFVGGTTGSGKSYAMGVITEEVLKHKLPVIFIDTQNEYGALVKSLGGKVVTPGEDFKLRLSNLSPNELINLIPGVTNSETQSAVVEAAFIELKRELAAGRISKFSTENLLQRIESIGPAITTPISFGQAKRRAETLNRNPLIGDGSERANWPELMVPCLSIQCKGLIINDLQLLATAVLRELQDLRKAGHIPPYLVVIDEAHLFVPQSENSPCKQIIREGVRIGRHHGIAMALLTQSPVDIDRSAIRQCNTRLIFALEPDQLDAIRGVKADASDEMLRALPKLPKGQCLLSGTYETVKHTVQVQIRRRETENSEGGATPDVFAEMNRYFENSRKNISNG